MTYSSILPVVALVYITGSAAPGLAQSTTGTWTLYPPQGTSFTTQVRPPIRTDGTSSFRATRRVLPVKFWLLSAPGPVVFQSILSDGTDPDPTTTNDYSFLSFDPSPELTFNQITTLKADYAFTMGNCGGGSLRWSVRVDVGSDNDPSNDGSVFIYYGDYPNFTDCTTTNQSSVNMIGQSDLRYDTSQVGGTFYDSYADAQTLVGSLRVVRTTLVIDSGWFNGDQKLAISNVMVNDNTFVPLSGTATRTCDRPPAAIKVTKTAGTGAGLISGVRSIQPGDDDTLFRLVDCKYMYNLDVSSLGTLANRPGTYQVEAVIGSTSAAGPAVFSLR